MQQSQRVAAGAVAVILGVLGLGWIGIHKFMLGYTKQGITYLLISVLTCGVGAAVMTIISIVEGIIYLTKTDAQFVSEYQIGRKEWF